MSREIEFRYDTNATVCCVNDEVFDLILRVDAFIVIVRSCVERELWVQFALNSETAVVTCMEMKDVEFDDGHGI